MLDQEKENPQMNLFILIIKGCHYCNMNCLKLVDEREFVNQMFKIILQILQGNKQDSIKLVYKRQLLYVLFWYPSSPIHKLADVVNNII